VRCRGLRMVTVVLHLSVPDEPSFGRHFSRALALVRFRDPPGRGVGCFDTRCYPDPAGVPQRILTERGREPPAKARLRRRYLGVDANNTNPLKDRPIVAPAAEARMAGTNPTITPWSERRGSQRIDIRLISPSRWISKSVCGNATNLRGPQRPSFFLGVEKFLALTRRGTVAP
jgi:hypothetical protein